MGALADGIGEGDIDRWQALHPRSSAPSGDVLFMTQRPASCVATVSSRGYEVGTAVLLTSLAARNPTLDAAFVVLHDGLEPRAARLLSAIPGVELVRVGQRLRSRLATLGQRYPDLRRWAPRFHSLEAFALDRFERVLFLDSDILCVGEIGGLLSSSEGLHACRDRAHREGGARDALSFLPLPADEVPPATAIRAFNAGVMLVGRDLLAHGSYHALLAALEETDWAQVRSGHTDQYLLNHLFRDRWQQLPDRYNRFVAPDGAPRSAIGERSDVFLHFVGRIKPWTGRVGPDWRRSHGARRQALRAWDRARLRWVLGRARRGDPRPLLEHSRREALRLAVRVTARATSFL